MILQNYQITAKNLNYIKIAVKTKKERFRKLYLPLTKIKTVRCVVSRLTCGLESRTALLSGRMCSPHPFLGDLANLGWADSSTAELEDDAFTTGGRGSDGPGPVDGGMPEVAVWCGGGTDEQQTLRNPPQEPATYPLLIKQENMGSQNPPELRHCADDLLMETDEVATPPPPFPVGGG